MSSVEAKKGAMLDPLAMECLLLNNQFSTIRNIHPFHHDEEAKVVRPSKYDDKYTEVKVIGNGTTLDKLNREDLKVLVDGLLKRGASTGWVVFDTFLTVESRWGTVRNGKTQKRVYRSPVFQFSTNHEESFDTLTEAAFEELEKRYKCDIKEAVEIWGEESNEYTIEIIVAAMKLIKKYKLEGIYRFDISGIDYIPCVITVDSNYSSTVSKEFLAECTFNPEYNLWYMKIHSWLIEEALRRVQGKETKFKVNDRVCFVGTSEERRVLKVFGNLVFLSEKRWVHRVFLRHIDTDRRLIAQSAVGVGSVSNDQSAEGKSSNRPQFGTNPHPTPQLTVVESPMADTKHSLKSRQDNTTAEKKQIIDLTIGDSDGESNDEEEKERYSCKHIKDYPKAKYCPLCGIPAIQTKGWTKKQALQLLDHAAKLARLPTTVLEQYLQIKDSDRGRYLNLDSTKPLGLESALGKIHCNREHQICSSEMSKEDFSSVIDILTLVTPIFIPKPAGPTPEQQIAAIYTKGNLRCSDRAPVPADLRAKLLKRSKGQCYCCGAGITNHFSEMAHIIPHRHGGAVSEDNLVAACSICNKAMGSINLFEWMLMAGKEGGVQCKEEEESKRKYSGKTHDEWLTCINSLNKRSVKALQRSKGQRKLSPACSTQIIDIFSDPARFSITQREKVCDLLL